MKLFLPHAKKYSVPAIKVINIWELLVGPERPAIILRGVQNIGIVLWCSLESCYIFYLKKRTTCWTLKEVLTLAVINNSARECSAAKLVRDLSVLGKEHAFRYIKCSASKVSFIFHAYFMSDKEKGGRDLLCLLAVSCSIILYNVLMP